MGIRCPAILLGREGGREGRRGGGEEVGKEAGRGENRHIPDERLIFKVHVQ